MSYLVLARKWRPKHFNELAGQEHVVKALTHALDQNRLHHAYLFTGTRGVGKTTIARIFAKALNCEQGVSSKPCGQCEACTQIDAGRFLDLLEVDAASRTKVEDTRDLLDNVQYTPTRGRFKIYLIDEVHMLSTHSFNALLKTLEEPPAHVKFLLATTDPQKLPVTVLSRCLQFNLKAVSSAVISRHLQQVLGAENIEFEADAAMAVALAAKGSVRDALSLLDQAISFGAGRVTLADIQAMLGDIGHDKVIDLLNALVSNDAEKILQLIDQAAQIAVDFDKLLNDIIAGLHKMALLQLVNEPPGADAAWRDYTQLAAQVSPEDVQLYYQIALYGRKDMDLATEPRHALEMIVLRMLAFRPVELATASVVKSVTASPRVNAPVQASQPLPAKQPEQPPLDMAIAQTKSVELPWQEMVAQLAITALTRQLAEHCILQSRTDKVWELVLSPKDKSLNTEGGQQRLHKALCEFIGKQVKLVIHIGDQAKANPAAVRARQQQQKEQAARDAIMGDTVVQELMKEFDAKISPDSIKPTDTD